jgi:hypothetical protein
MNGSTGLTLSRIKVLLRPPAILPRRSSLHPSGRRLIRLNSYRRARRLPFGDLAAAARFTGVTWTASR